MVVLKVNMVFLLEVIEDVDSSQHAVLALLDELDVASRSTIWSKRANNIPHLLSRLRVERIAVESEVLDRHALVRYGSVVMLDRDLDTDVLAQIRPSPGWEPLVVINIAIAVMSLRIALHSSLTILRLPSNWAQVFNQIPQARDLLSGCTTQHHHSRMDQLLRVPENCIGDVDIDSEASSQLVLRTRNLTETHRAVNTSHHLQPTGKSFERVKLGAFVSVNPGALNRKHALGWRLAERVVHDVDGLEHRVAHWDLAVEVLSQIAHWHAGDKLHLEVLDGVLAAWRWLSFLQIVDVEVDAAVALGPPFVGAERKLE